MHRQYFIKPYVQLKMFIKIFAYLIELLKHTQIEIFIKVFA